MYCVKNGKVCVMVYVPNQKKWVYVPLNKMTRRDA